MEGRKEIIPELSMPHFNKVRDKFLSRSVVFESKEEEAGDLDDLYVKIKDKKLKKKKKKDHFLLSLSGKLPSSPSSPLPSLSFDASELMATKVKLIGDLNKNNAADVIDVWDTCECLLASALELRDINEIIRSSLSYVNLLNMNMRLLSNNIDDNDNSFEYDNDNALDDIKNSLESCLHASYALNDEDKMSLSMKTHSLITTTMLLSLCITIKKEKEKLREYKSIMIAKDVLERRQVASLLLEIDRLKLENDDLIDQNEYLTTVNDRMRQQQIEDFELIQQRMTKTIEDERESKLHEIVENISKFTVQDMLDSKYNDDELQSMEYELRISLKRVSRARDEIEKRKKAIIPENNTCCICLEGILSLYISSFYQPLIPNTL